jgi:hypothetical protein
MIQRRELTLKIRYKECATIASSRSGSGNISSVNKITNATNLSVGGSLPINDLTDDMHDIVADNQVEMVEDVGIPVEDLPRTQAELNALKWSDYNLRRDKKYGHLHGRWREREDSGDSARLYRISVRKSRNRFPENSFFSYTTSQRGIRSTTAASALNSGRS